MKNTFGQSVTVSIFGESHGGGIGAILSGIAPGIEIDTEFIQKRLDLRRAKNNLSTSRREADECEILSGVFEGRTTGTPIAMIIRNENTKSGDYSILQSIARPGHADYTANCKYHGFQDYRGGGHFSGRITAALTAAGAVALLALKQKGIEIGTHMKTCGGISDREFDNLKNDIEFLNNAEFPMLDKNSGEKAKQAILDAKTDGDSVGGILQTAIIGITPGAGEPFFDSVESVLAHMLFSIPGIKGVEFGDGFEITKKRGSQANDEFTVSDGEIITKTNSNGGINGGITNGMPILINCAVKPTPSIFKAQNTVDFKNNTDTVLDLKGRHDPAIIHRARAVVDSAVALALCDLLAQRFGTDYFTEAKQ